MSDPYWSFAAAAAAANIDGVPRSSFPGYFPSDGPGLPSHHSWGTGDLRGASSDYLQNDRLPLRSGAYGFDDRAAIGSRGTPGFGGLAAGTSAFPTPLDDPTLISQRTGLGGLAAGASVKGFPTPLDDPALISQRPDVAGIGNKSGISDGLLGEETNLLFVDGLPSDCTRREVAHLFRPFIGFKEIKVVHKEPRRSGDKGLVLCFVEFNDAKCAITALEALQGYRFDDRKPDAPVLRIQFAKFPFRPSSMRDDRRLGSVH